MNISTIGIYLLVCTILTTHLLQAAAPAEPHNPDHDPAKDTTWLANRRTLAQWRTLPSEYYWYDALFSLCRGCEKKDAHEKIDCKKLLAQNPHWEEEVAYMSKKTKRTIMVKALDRFIQDNDACNLACALCMGGDPDVENSSSPFHTALHLSTGTASKPHPIFRAKGAEPNYGIFNLLLRQGADPNLRCISTHPLEFDIPDSWKKDLIEYGAKLSNHDDN